MPTQKVFLCPLVLMVLMVSPSALVGGNNPDAKAAVHVRAHNAEAGCDYTIPHGEILTCEDVVTSELERSFDAFPVFFNLSGYRGCEYSMMWPSFSHNAAFTSCADFVIGDISNPGDGVSHAWQNCQSGVCVPGFIWLYADSPAQVCLIPHPVGRLIKVLDCSFEVDLVFWAYCAGVYGEVGDDPCEPPGGEYSGIGDDWYRQKSTEPAVWGEVKSLFR